MAISLFPPILSNFQEAFEYTQTNYIINFMLPSVMSDSDIKHIQIKIVRQTNNSTIVNTNRYPDGIIYKDYATDQPELKEVEINIQDLADGWEEGALYKVQLRFGKNEKWYSGSLPSAKDIENFATWRESQVQQRGFSEWSSVMIIKAIAPPTAFIANASATKEGVVATQNLESSTTPLFIGQCEFPVNSKEVIDKYRFALYDNDNNKIEDSGWLQHNATANGSVSTYRFSTVLTNGESYIVYYNTISNNGYQLKSDIQYNFKVQENYLSELEDVELYIDNVSPYCFENGCLQIYLKAPVLSGNYVLIRTSEKSNYSVWEEIQYFLYSAETFDKTLIYRDFTIESGIKYKYAFQQENSLGLRTAPVYEYGNQGKSIDFEYTYLYTKNIQLKLKYDNQMSSFKHTVLASKNDTIGSKHPTITRNGHAYYAEFPITGLISLQMDDDETFFVKKEDGYYYQNKLVIPIDKYSEDEFTTNLTHNNIFIERIFREKVEEFLNDGDYKLYKSATEGNIIVSLMNVSLTPKNELGRMIFSFSATAYEALDFSLSNLNKYGLIEIGGFKEFAEDQKTILLGQINGLFAGQHRIEVGANGKRTFVPETSPDNLLDLIKEQIEINTGGGYKWKFLDLLTIEVEQYPALQFKNEIYELEAERIALISADEPDEELIAEYDEKIANLKALRDACLSQPTYPLISLIIGGKELSVGKNKKYYLKDVFNNLDKIYLKYSGPIIINFTCSAVQEEDISLIVESIDTSLVWGQLAGIFTSSYDILKNYDYQYKENPTYRIPQLNDNDFHYDKNFTVFETENIFEIIKEYSRKEIEINYEISEGFTNYVPETDTWDNGTIFYNFLTIDMIEIEADEGTMLKIKTDNIDITKNEILVTIGPSAKYVVNPSNNMIKSISFAKPTYALINYKCSTMQTTHKEET